jgi:hypothetical protein
LRCPAALRPDEFRTAIFTEDLRDPEIGRPPVHEPSSLERLVAAKQAKKGSSANGTRVS